LVLRHQADAGAELQLLGRRRGKGQADERIVRVRIALGQLAADGKRRLAARRDVGGLGHVERVEAPILQSPRELGDVDAVVGGEIESTNAHDDPPLLFYFFAASTWPPKPSRIADSTFSAKVCCWRERKRTNSEATSTSAGTASSMA